MNPCFFWCLLWGKPGSHNHPCLSGEAPAAQENQPYLETFLITMGSCQMPRGQEEGLIKYSV